MSVKKTFIIILICCCAMISLSGRPGQTQESSASVDQAKLNKILETAGDYCERLKSMALYFVCHENITERTSEFDRSRIVRFVPDSEKNNLFTIIDDLRVTKTIKHSFIFDYQMIKKGKDLKEKRDLLEENGKRRNEKDVEFKTLRMSAKYLVFGPVGFLSKSWQPHFQYEIIGPGKVGKKSAVVLRAVPREISEENNCFGRIWVDEGDSSILQIEWEPRSIANFKEIVDSPIGGLKRRISWTVIYDIVKNGIRFPSAQAIKETFLTPLGKEHTKYEAAYLYNQYRFFTVETDVIYD